VTIFASAEKWDCAVCQRPAKKLLLEPDEVHHQQCPRCGEFKLPQTAGKTLCRMRKSSIIVIKLSGWIQDQNMVGNIPALTDEQLKLIEITPTLGIQDRANRFLQYAVKKAPTLYSRFDIADPVFLAITYSNDQTEVKYLGKFLEEQGVMRLIGDSGKAEITAHGHLRCEELNTRPSASTQGFVAMWFDESMKEAYSSGFEIALREAGYDPVRVDRVEHVGKIDDEIIAQIRKSRFVVADLTSHRGGVYFEAGFALGLNLPVFWTCRRSDFDHGTSTSSSSTASTGAKPGELADRLQKRIEAVIGAGPRRPQGID
jgi:hypothetical protein